MRGLIGVVVLWASVVNAQTLRLPGQPARLWPGNAECAGPAINVKCPPYNATGNGVTDDTAALQAASTACENAGGGVIYAPRGTYLASQWTVGSKCVLRGDGIDITTFKCSATEPNFCILASGGGKKATNGSNYGTAVTDVVFLDFTLDGEGETRQAASLGGYVRGIGVAHASEDIRFERVRVVDGGSRAIEPSFPKRLSIVDSLCEDSSHRSGSEGDCIHINTECSVTSRNPPGWCGTEAEARNCEEVTVDRTTVLRPGDQGISVSKCRFVHVTNNTVLGYEYFGSTSSPDEGGLDLEGLRDAVVTGNVLQCMRNNDIRLAQESEGGFDYESDNVTIANNRIVKCGDAETGWAAIQVGGFASRPAKNIHIEGNSVRSAPWTAIRVGTEVYGFTVSNNTVLDANTLGTGVTEDVAIEIAPSAGSPVTNGVVSANVVEGASGTLGHCIAVKYSGSTGAGSIHVVDNVCREAVLGPLSIAAAQRVLVRHMTGHSASGQSLVTSAMLNSGGVLQGAARGSEVWCSDCTYDATTGLCNTGGAGTLPYRPAFKADNTLGNWCCATGKGFTTCGNAIAASDLPTTVRGPSTDSPNTCTADRNGNQYLDTSLNEVCTCNSSHSSGARWCQVDGGGCTSSTSCG